LANASDPFAYIAQIAQMQAVQLQTRQAQAQAHAAAPSPNPSANDEVVRLRAQLAEKDKQLAAAQQQQMTPPTPQFQTAPQPQQPTTPQPSTSHQPQRAQPTRRASFVHSDGYVSDGAGGLVYQVAIENDGEVPVTCDTRVQGIVWSGGAGGNSLQSNYSDRRTSVVYPGRKQVVAGFSRVVANSGSYEVSCEG